MAIKTNFKVNNKEYYKLSATVGKKPDGKPIRKVFYGKSKKEAETKRQEYLLQINKGIALDFDKLILGQFMKMWLFEVEKSKLKPSSFSRYETIYRVHLSESELFGLKVCDIKSIQIQKFYNDLWKIGKPTATITSINKVLKKFFNYCVKEDIIVKNPCMNVNIPRDSEFEETKIEVFTSDEINLIKQEIADSGKYFVFMFALLTGLRQGEILALKMSDIDFENRMISINKSAKYISVIKENEARVYERIVQTPKSRLSVRTVPFPESMEPYLAIHIKNERIKHLKLGVVHNSDSLVFTSEAGTPINESNLRVLWKRFLKRINVKHRKFHTLRHTYCTVLAENGVSLKTASMLMGHDVSMTAKIYTHVSDLEKRKAVDAISHIIIK